ncbi:MAG: peptidoglycan-binding domain-containing protein [Pseudomonadota bacterium]
MATMKIGSTGKDVTNLQQALQRAKLRPRVEATGTYDKTTAAAVKAFQKQAGLKPDGIAGRTTMQHLGSGERAPVPLKRTIPDYNALYDNFGHWMVKQRVRVRELITFAEGHHDPRIVKLGKALAPLAPKADKTSRAWLAQAKIIIRLSADFERARRSNRARAQQILAEMESRHRAAEPQMQSWLSLEPKVDAACTKIEVAFQQITQYAR